eukprot:SAG11_NODE_1329_length_5192_cov_3.608286_3_plen_592_part_00
MSHTKIDAFELLAQVPPTECLSRSARASGLCCSAPRSLPQACDSHPQSLPPPRYAAGLTAMPTRHQSSMIATLASHVATTDKTASQLRCSTVPGQVSGAHDTLGNCWRLDSDQQRIWRTDCYLRSAWASVPKPDSSHPLVALATISAGLTYLTDGERIWAIDGRRGVASTNPESRTSPPAEADYSGLAFDPGFGVWTETGVRTDSPITALSRTHDGLLLITTALARLEGIPHPVGRNGPPRVELLTRDYGLSSEPGWKGRWREVARIPGGGNHDVACCLAAGEVFVAGGIGDWVGFPADVHLFSELWAFNPTTESWRVASHLPHPTCFCGLASVGGNVWVVGGADDRGPRPSSVAAHAQRGVDGQPTRALTHVQIFDPKPGRWSDGPPLSTRREGFAGHLALAVGGVAGRVYSFTCPSDDAHFAEGVGLLESCAATAATGGAEADTREWEPEPPPPLKLDNPAGAVVGEVLYAVCGAGVCAFDTRSRQWRVLPPYPMTSGLPLLTAPHVCEHQGKLWVLSSGGGRSPVGGGCRCFVYDPAVDEWVDGPEAPVPRGWGGAISVAGSVLLVGGAYYCPDSQASFFDDRCFLLK